MASGNHDHAPDLSNPVDSKTGQWHNISNFQRRVLGHLWVDLSGISANQPKPGEAF